MLRQKQLPKSCLIICLLLLTALGGCGNKGPLTYPDSSQQHNR